MTRGEFPGPACPLCGCTERTIVPDTGVVAYRDCTRCGLIAMDPQHHPSREKEKAHYDTHENDPDDPRYRAFLGRLAGPLIEKLDRGAEGLDYGSGPGPTLSLMLEEAGFPMRIYDPFYAPDRDALSRRYDFIACTETVEHFHNPKREFELLDRLLKPGGCFGIMTEILPPKREFAGWWYRRDPTHVVFYRERTFRWLAGKHGWIWERSGRTVVLFRKPPQGAEAGTARSVSKML